MSPMWIIEGRRDPIDPVVERDAAERKLAALAEAVREHQLRISGEMPDSRPQDHHLYHRLHEICGGA